MLLGIALAGLFSTGEPGSSVVCDASATDATALRQHAASLYLSGDYEAADACVSSALIRMTEDLALLAAQAEALRNFRDARRASPTLAPSASGCMVDANGLSVCLPGLTATAAAAVALPSTAAECGSEEAALTLLQQHEGAVVSEGSAENAALDMYIMQSTQRLWWTAATRAVDVLRAGNVPPSSEARRTVTAVRDSAGAVLALMRQTKLDEATISCAVMWAQGEFSVHLNVKFASRLDAPVTVLNVDNEVVEINSTHVSFSGIGRQKPKRYVVQLELFAPIEPENSTWQFGSVGTVKFVLRKAKVGQWARLSASSENVKNHRVWWEKQDQVEREDRKEREEIDRLAREAKAEAQKAEQEKMAKEAEAKAAALRAEQAALRATQLPSLEVALSHVEELLAAPSEQIDEKVETSLTSAKKLMEVTEQDSNETAVATAAQMLNAIRSLRQTGFQDLTKDALDSAVTQYRSWLEAMVVAAPVDPPSPPKKAKKRKKSKAAAK
uniref:CS domain-containing protein n=1 Tax=Haptolina brevifila TaxID=156173 RepID=A0A7S2HMW9_9EUKA|mmetsp:Transcript_56086/g.111319  ORF Transcript_56086/g.111319 Transcript_56086/m.111319 type:complete len:499 (+) Transcript_56086:67-1563(+)